jgi:predicted Zn-dependent protease
LLSTVECLIACREYAEAAELLLPAFDRMASNPDVWLTLDRVQALRGHLEAARASVKEYARLNPAGRVALLAIKELDLLW